jgi:hypothetical protein
MEKFFEPGFRIRMKLMLRRTLVLQQSYELTAMSREHSNTSRLVSLKFTAYESSERTMNDTTEAS